MSSQSSSIQPGLGAWLSRAGDPGVFFRRAVQDDNEHFHILRFPFFFLGAGENPLPKFGIEFQEKVHQLPEGLAEGSRFSAGSLVDCPMVFPLPL